MKERIATPNEKELAWIAEQLGKAVDFVIASLPQREPSSIGLEVLDQAFAAWMASTAAKEPATVNAIINCVGIAFGQSLVDGLGLRWVMATGEHGADLAVYGLPGKGDVLVYPADFVAKRWERGETDFLADSYRRMEIDVKTTAGRFRQ